MPWTHRRLRRQVSAYIDGELDPVSTARVGRHLRWCWGCNGAAEEIRLIKASFVQLGRQRPPPLAAVRMRRWAGSLGGQGH